MFNKELSDWYLKSTTLMCGPSSSLSSLHVCRSVDCLPQKHSLQFQCFFLFYSYSDSLFYILLPASVFLPFFFLPLDFSTCVSLSDTCVLLPSCINSPCLALVLFGRCFCSVVASVPSWLFPPGCLIGFVSVVCIFVQVCKSVSVLFLFFFLV